MAFVKFILNGWENEIVPSCSEPHGQGRQQTVQSRDTLTVSHDLSATHFSVHVDSIQQCFECFLCVLYNFDFTFDLQWEINSQLLCAYCIWDLMVHRLSFVLECTVCKCTLVFSGCKVERGNCSSSYVQCLQSCERSFARGYCWRPTQGFRILTVCFFRFSLFFVAVWT